MMRACVKLSVFLVATASAKEVGSCGPDSPSKVEDCTNVDFGSCGNACCKLAFTVDQEPLAAMQMLNNSLGNGGSDGSFADNTFTDLRQFHPPGGYEFIGQVHHTTTGPKHYQDVVNFNIRPNFNCTTCKGSFITVFSLSLIAGALGDNGQNYKNIQLAMKSVQWKGLYQGYNPEGSCPLPAHVVSNAVATAVAPRVNLTIQEDRNACLKAVQKYRPDIHLCAPQYQQQADIEAAYDNTHGGHAYLKAYGVSGTCSSSQVASPQVVAQCECPNWGQESWQACTDAYYNEGPGGGHHDIMMCKVFKCVSCGYGGGTMTHNFCSADSLPGSQEAVVV